MRSAPHHQGFDSGRCSGIPGAGLVGNRRTPRSSSNTNSPRGKSSRTRRITKTRQVLTLMGYEIESEENRTTVSSTDSRQTAR